MKPQLDMAQAALPEVQQEMYERLYQATVELNKVVQRDKTSYRHTEAMRKRAIIEATLEQFLAKLALKTEKANG